MDANRSASWQNLSESAPESYRQLRLDSLAERGFLEGSVEGSCRNEGVRLAAVRPVLCLILEGENLSGGKEGGDVCKNKDVSLHACEDMGMCMCM